MTLPSLKSLVVTTLILSSLGVYAQNYYVVVGAYRVQKYADLFTGYVRNAKYDAKQGMHEKRNLTYIYVLKTENRKEASAMTIKLQKETEFEDAWLYEGPLTTDEPTPIVIKEEPKEEIPVVVVPKEEPVELPKEEPKEEPIEEPKEEPVDEDKPLPPARGKYFKFIVTTQDGNELNTQVHNVDRMQGRDLAVYKTNEYVDVLSPVDPSMPLSIVCGVFGYAEAIQLIDFNDPSQTPDATLDDKGAWIIPYKLERLKKGDVTVMYDVAFYKDASIMTPASKTELDELVDMMRLNPNYFIKIHGHNNGNDKNLRITTMGKDKNYFAMAGSNIKNGNGKDLSKLRAETIQSYLEDNGIDKKRTEIYAWGGMEMLVKQGSTVAARLNNRIEIEILQD